MAGAADMNSTGKRLSDRAAATRGPLVLWAALAALMFTGRAEAQTPDPTPGNLPAAPAPASPNFANGNPAAAQKAVQDAIPLTPEMIEELGRRFNATQRAREEAVTPLAVPLNRQINVSR
jgi:intracellular multiplication protein IcmK